MSDSRLGASPIKTASIDYFVNSVVSFQADRWHLRSWIEVMALGNDLQSMYSAELRAFHDFAEVQWLLWTKQLADR